MAPTPTPTTNPVLKIQDCSLEERLQENSPCWKLDQQINEQYDHDEEENEQQAEKIVKAVGGGISPWWWIGGFFGLVLFALFFFFMRNGLVWRQGRFARRG